MPAVTYSMWHAIAVPEQGWLWMALPRADATGREDSG